MRHETFSWVITTKSLQNTSEAASWRCCCVLKNLTNFIGKHLCWNLFLKHLQALRSATLYFIKNRLHPTQVLSCGILTNICERLLLILQEELMSSFSRIFYSNEFLWIFLISLLWTVYHGNTSWTMHLHYAWRLSWQGKKKFSTTTKINLVKIHFYSLASLAYYSN